MSLIPCNVCGTLNSEEAEICLSCEYPIRGSRRSPIFQWAALLLFLLFMAPLIGVVVNRLKPQAKPQPSVSQSLNLMASSNLPCLHNPGHNLGKG